MFQVDHLEVHLKLCSVFMHLPSYVLANELKSFNRITCLMDHKVCSHKQDSMVLHKMNLLRAISAWLELVLFNRRY